MAAKGKSSLVVREIVKIVELDPILVGDEEMWFRIEVCKEPGRTKRFTARTWRTERYRIQSATPLPGDPVHPQSEQTVLVDSSHLFEEIAGASAKAVLDKTLHEIESRFLKRR